MRTVTVPRIYAIADEEALGAGRLPEVVAELAAAGILWLQVRMKRAADSEYLACLEACAERLEGSGVALWVNDRADLAALLPVFGVHVGQDDLPPAAVRRVVGDGVAIGCSSHDEEQLAGAAADQAVDVVACGPVFPTRSKEGPDPVVGLEVLRRARELTAKPVVAIGGIDTSNLDQVFEAGADAAAMIGALGSRDTSTRQIGRNARQLVRRSE